MTLFLDVDRVIQLHRQTAGAVPVIDRATLESAVARCRAGFGEQEAFPRVVDKAAALLHGIASTQCFQDGNKRAAWLATVVFLEINGFDLPVRVRRDRPGHVAIQVSVSGDATTSAAGQ